MKKVISILIAIFLLHNINFAQSSSALKKVMTLKITTDGGANGAGVVWHPIQKKYYAGMAGNESFQMGVFDGKGKLLSSDTLTTQTDLRGLWYNPKLNTIQSNAYASGGWNEYKLNKSGMPAGIKNLFAGMNQPADNAVGTYNPTTNQVYFLNYVDFLEILVYDMKTAENTKTIKLHLQNSTMNAAKDLEDLDDDYNSTTALYTGIPTKEIALLNNTESRIEFYNVKTGFMTGTKAFPEDTKTEDMFNFAYANGIFWLFNKADREWNGFK